MAAADSTPFTNMRFRVEIEGAKGVGAVEVILPVAHRETGANGKQTTQFGTMTLRRGLTRSSEWYDWWSKAQASPRGTERAVRVVLIDESGADAIAWLLAGAVPIGYSVSSLNALGHEPVIESLELRVNGFEASFESAPKKGRKRA